MERLPWIVWVNPGSSHGCVFSCSVVADSLWPMSCSPRGSSVYVIVLARNTGAVAIFSCRGSFQPRDRTHISCIAGRFFTTEPLGNPQGNHRALERGRNRSHGKDLTGLCWLWRWKPTKEFRQPLQSGQRGRGEQHRIFIEPPERAQETQYLDFF